MLETHIEPRQVAGSVKWFDATRGFGFIVDDEDGAGDILLHANVLRAYGQTSVVEQARIVVLVVDTPRGRQASEILSIAPPEGEPSAAIEDLGHVTGDQLEKLPLQPARIKWFDKAKGFGFANIFGQDDDVFLHIEVLRHGGFADLPTGEAVVLRVIDGQRGRIAAQVMSWEIASRLCAPTNDAGADQAHSA